MVTMLDMSFDRESCNPSVLCLLFCRAGTENTKDERKVNTDAAMVWLEDW